MNWHVLILVCVCVCIRWIALIWPLRILPHASSYFVAHRWTRTYVVENHSKSVTKCFRNWKYCCCFFSFARSQVEIKYLSNQKKVLIISALWMNLAIKNKTAKQENDYPTPIVNLFRMDLMNNDDNNNAEVKNLMLFRVWRNGHDRQSAVVQRGNNKNKQCWWWWRRWGEK